MGQTLSHGVYLPAEGERNCYSGLASNWNLLDTAIGDTAGKASATHTHGNITNDGKVGTTANLPLITGAGGAVQAGSFGNAANTFCEGNDSRLSDARTPVAHTHTKSDVTDLLNSNFIPSANNSYDLGSSSYQWNNLYAKNYFYNGTAWGLDKSNVWSQVQTISYSGVPTIRYIHPSLDIGSAPASDRGMQLNFCDAGTNIVSAFQYLKGSGVSRISIALSTKNSNNQIIGKTLRLQTNQEGTTWDFYPSGNGEINLGTSNNKWKSFNGINPGALSIFNPSATQDPIDIPNTWVTDGSAWNALNVSNMGDGWICLTYRLCGPNDYILARFGGTNANIYPSMIFPVTRLADSGYFVYALVPVAKAMGNIYLEIKLDSNAVLVKHSFIPAYGTV